jgi:hypothetical protein
MSGRIWLRLSRDRIVAEARRGKKVLWTGSADYGDINELGAVIGDLMNVVPAGRRLTRVMVEIEPPLIQVRHIADLPPVSERVLKAMVKTQAGRYFRRNGSPLVTDAVWVAGTNGATRVAHMAALEESFLSAVAEGADLAGLTLVDVGPPVEEGKRLSLLPPKTLGSRRQAARRGVLRWAMIASAAWLTVALIFGVRLYRERERVDHELTRLARPAAALLTLRQEIRQARDMVAVVDSADRVRGNLAEILQRITRAIPDSAFLTSLALTNRGAGNLTGYAPRATEVVAGLERIAGFHNPHLQGEVTREIRGSREWDRFTIVFEEPGTGRLP